MGQFTVDATSEPGIVRVTLSGSFSEEEMHAFVLAHNAAIDRLAGADYCIWADLAAMLPVTGEVSDILEAAKRYSASMPSFRGSAVKVASATVALLSRRTSITSGVDSTELISDDEHALRAHLRTLPSRRPGDAKRRNAPARSLFPNPGRRSM